MVTTWKNVAGASMVWVRCVVQQEGGEMHFSVRFKNVYFGLEALKYKRVTRDLVIASHFLISHIFIN